MPNYLALEWHRGGIRGLDAEMTGDAVRVRATFSHDWPEELDAANDAEGVGLWLKSRLETLDRRDRRLLVLVSREDIVMRLLALPEASDTALPDLVRYQTGTRSSVPLDQLVLDYLPLVAGPKQGGRWVQSATVPTRLLKHIEASATAAGLDLARVGVTTVALGEAIAHAERMRGLTAEQTSLIVRVVGEQLDIVLWRGTDLLFGHVCRASESSSVVSEVQRALLSHQEAAGDGGIGRAWLISSPALATDLQPALATRLGCEVIVYDPSRDMPAGGGVNEASDDAAHFVAAWGALQAGAQAKVATIDFLSPRRRVVKPDRTKIIAAAVVGLLLFLLATAYLGSRFYLNSLDKLMAEQAKIARDGDEKLKQREPAREAVAFLDSWGSEQADWLEQMRRIADEMPGTERVYLDRWRFDAGAGAALGTTEATGYARLRQDAQQFSQRLAEQPGFRVRANPLGTAGNDPEYPILFQLNAELVATPRRPARNESE